MRAAAERGAKLTDQLLSFSRRQRLEPKVLNLNETVRGMRDLLQSTIGGSIAIDIALGPGCGRRWSTRPRSSSPCSTSPSMPATPWISAARCGFRRKT